LADAFAVISMNGKRVLCLLGKRASSVVTDALAADGAEVVRVESYRSQSSLEDDSRLRSAVRSGRVDVVVFASPSSVQTVTTELGADLAALSGACLVAIGDTTRGAMEQAGLPVHVVAEKPTPAGIVAACRTYFAERSGIGGTGTA
jgi:uroporphyrinogen-III synthase